MHEDERGIDAARTEYNLVCVNPAQLVGSAAFDADRHAVNHHDPGGQILVEHRDVGAMDDRFHIARARVLPDAVDHIEWQQSDPSGRHAVQVGIPGEALVGGGLDECLGHRGEVTETGRWTLIGPLAP
jgi:hypothetical protein